MNKDETLKFVESKWDNWYVKGVSEFISVPNLSPNYDSEFLTNGRIEQAMKLVDDYINELNIKGISKKVFWFKPPYFIFKKETFSCSPVCCSGLS